MTAVPQQDCLLSVIGPCDTQIHIRAGFPNVVGSLDSLCSKAGMPWIATQNFEELSDDSLGLLVQANKVTLKQRQGGKPKVTHPACSSDHPRI